MGEKSLKKKNYIVEKAREVFCERGFSSVTMKDVVEACDISRGGLYLYFADTNEIFEAVLQAEYDALGKNFVGEESDTAGDILLAYLLEQKKEILKKKDSIAMARYEFMYANRASKKDNLAKKKFQEELKALEKLIQTGVSTKWMVCDNPQIAARNIMFTLEGLRVVAQTTGLTADVMDKEIECIMGSVGLTIK